jgi:hypothetical protein
VNHDVKINISPFLGRQHLLQFFDLIGAGVIFTGGQDLTGMNPSIHLFLF